VVFSLRHPLANLHFLVNIIDQALQDQPGVNPVDDLLSFRPFTTKWAQSQTNTNQP